MIIAKDKNGVELKVGDRVYHSDHPDELSLVTDIPADRLIELDRGGYYTSEYLIKIQEARTYTEAEIREAYYACEYSEGEVIDEMFELLNAPKP